MNKKFIIYIFIVFFCISQFSNDLSAFDPAAGEKGSKAISKDHKSIIQWASGYINYIPGEDVDSIWKTPEKALGKAEGNSHDIVCLGREGEITLLFNKSIKNNTGLDFAVFENSFSDNFLELAKIYVSTDGIHFVCFRGESLTKKPVSSFGNVNPENIYNFAGKYRQGFGTGFDLEELKDEPLVKSGKVNIDNINYIKVVDIKGDGSFKDSKGNPVYDPFPTRGSSGFDLDGICVLSGVVFGDLSDKEENNSSPKKETGPGFGNESGCFINSVF